MSRSVWVPYVLLLLGLVGAPVSLAAADGETLPSDAAKRLTGFRDQAAAVQMKADAETKRLLERLLQDLEALQTTYTKAGSLDEAVAIRDEIRLLRKTPLEQMRALLEGDRRLRPAGAAGGLGTAPLPPLPGELPPVELPKHSPRMSIVRERKELVGLRVTFLDLPAALIVGDVVWNAKGDTFYTLTNEGVLSRVVLEGFKEERRLDLGRRCSFLALSAEGLLTAMTDLQEVWLIDSRTLSVRKRISVPGIQRVLSGPSLQTAFAAAQGRVYILDLAKGKVARMVDAPTQNARITPDGRYYFAQEGIEQLFSYRIDGTQLIQDQKSGRIAQNGQSICVSSDSKYVCLPSGGGNYGALYGTYVYAVDNLSKPVVTIPSGAYPRLVGFDPAAGLIYAQNFSHQLLVFTDAAIKKGEFNLSSSSSSRHPGEPRQFIAHPSGKRLLILAGTDLAYVELEL